jgi:hypothetical protein
MNPDTIHSVKAALDGEVAAGRMTPQERDEALADQQAHPPSAVNADGSPAQFAAPGTPPTPTAAPPAAPTGAPPGLQLPPGARMKDGSIFVPSGMSAKGQISYTPYKAPKPVPTKISHPADVAAGWAAGVDMTNGGAPATPEQKAKGEAFIAKKRQDAAQRAKAIAMEKPAGAEEKKTLEATVEIVQTGNELLKKLKNPDVRKWLGPQGHLQWWLYNKAGKAPNLDIGEFTTLSQVFGAESVGRLLRLMNTRSKAIYEDLRVHPPSPWDVPSQTENKIQTIINIAKGLREVQTKVMTTSTRDLPRVTEHLAQKDLDPRPKGAKAAPQAAPEAPPQAQGTPVPGAERIMFLGPAQAQ